MTNLRAWLTCAALAGLLLAGVAAYGGEPGGGGGPASTGERFDDPEAIAKRFSRELTRLADEPGTLSPADLARQAEEAKNCAVELLPDPGQKLAPEEIYSRARRSVVIVGGISKHKRFHDWYAFCAAGFVVHKEGVIVTNYHVVTSFQDMKAVGVMTDDGRVFPVQAVLAADKRNDVAVLRIGAKNLVPLPMAEQVPIGATVYCLSHPSLRSERTENGFYTFTPGMVTGRFRLRLGGGGPVDVLTVTTDYAKGSSGAPILNEHGAVAAMVCETLPIYHDENVGDVQMIWKFSRPASAIRPLLRGPGPPAKP